MEYKKKMKEWARRRVGMVKLSEKGLSLSQIAKINSITKQRVLQILQEEKEKESTRA